MNPYRKGILTVLCLVALGLMLFGGMQIGLEVAKHALQRKQYEQAHAAAGNPVSLKLDGEHPPRLAVGRCVLYAVPFVLGAGLLIKSAAIADRLAEEFDD